MSGVTSQRMLVPLALLILSLGAYSLVLLGIVPFGLSAPAIVAVIAGGTAIGAALLGEQVPAATAGLTAVGFALSTASPIGGIALGGMEYTISSALAIVGGLGFILSTIYLTGTRCLGVNPTKLRP